MHSRTTADVWLYFLTLQDESWPIPLRFVDNNADIEVDGETYTAWSYEVSLPEDNENGLQSVSLSICNVDRSLTAAIRELESPLQVTLAAGVVPSDPLIEPTIEIDPIEFDLVHIRGDARTLTGELITERIFDESFPFDEMDPSGFPCLFQPRQGEPERVAPSEVPARGWVRTTRHRPKPGVTP